MGRTPLVQLPAPSKRVSESPLLEAAPPVIKLQEKAEFPLVTEVNSHSLFCVVKNGPGTPQRAPPSAPLEGSSQPPLAVGSTSVRALDLGGQPAPGGAVGSAKSGGAPGGHH